MAELKRFAGELGEIFISEEVIESLIVGIISEQEGLKAPNQAAGDEGILEVLAKSYKGSGVEIEKEDERLALRLSLIAKYGVKIDEAAWKLIREVKQKVEEMAGLEVGDIEVDITGIEIKER